MNERDRMLGMDRDITRRDFLNGASLAIGGSMLGLPLAPSLGATAGAQAQAGYYPPMRHGMRSRK